MKYKINEPKVEEFGFPVLVRDGTNLFLAFRLKGEIGMLNMTTGHVECVDEEFVLHNYTHVPKGHTITIWNT